MDTTTELPKPPTEWTYPTRACRICFEEVPATVTMYPPGIPITLQRPVVEYKNSDEYGRLVRPCKCKGGMRYIHELCLVQSRVEGGRKDAKWKCPTCGHSFNFQRLSVQKLLLHPAAVAGLTVIVLVVIIFVLGFIADPIINLYFDPYETLTHSDYWHEVDLNDVVDDSGWSAHFTKGFVTMGLVGFLKTLLANPWRWWNFRATFMPRAGTAATGNTGQERVVNVSWITVAIGIGTAFYFFYQWIQSIVGRTLHRIGNNIVDTHLPGDDDDIKPPPGYRFQPPASDGSETASEETQNATATDTEQESNMPGHFTAEDKESSDETKSMEHEIDTGQSSGIQAALSQGWSFVDLSQRL